MKGKKFPESYAGLYKLWYGYDKLCSGGNWEGSWVKMQADEESKISKARATSSLFLFFQELCNIPVSVMLNGKVLNQKGENVKA